MKRKTMKPLFSAVKDLLDKLLFGYMHKTGLLLCAGHTNPDSYTNARYYISATLPATYDQAGYQDTDIVWSEITQVSKFPQYGPMADKNEFVPIRGAKVKAKRTPDYGGGAMEYADLPSESSGGQAIVKTASLANVPYSMKIVQESDSETDFLEVLVMSCQKSPQSSGDFKLRTANIEVQRAPVNIPGV
jgi:hypothetical protein